jgi:hypothetical protein
MAQVVSGEGSSSGSAPATATTPDTDHGLVEQLVAAEHAVRNTDDGYWIGSFDPRAAHHSLSGSRTIGTGPS